MRLRHHALARPGAVALQQVAPECAAISPMTWRQLWDATNALTICLVANAEPHSTVLLCAPNRPEYIVAFLAALAADMTVFPVHPCLTATELDNSARRSGAAVFIGPRCLFDAVTRRCRVRIGLEHVIDASAEDRVVAAGESNHAAMLLQSSGTTGSPKIVHRDGPAIDAVARNVASSVGLGPRDHVLAAVPLCHSYGVESALLAPILAGACVHLCDGFDPATVCRAMAVGGITVFPGVPFMFEVLGERCDHAPQLRQAYSAGGPLSRGVHDLVRDRLGVSIGQLYGSTEIGAVTFNDSATKEEFDPCSVGRAMPGVEIRIVEAGHSDVGEALPVRVEGQVAVSAPSMLDRYIDDPASPLTSGFFMTGDLGRMDEHGRLTITGRVKLQIDVGGLKVNPIEVEQVILSHAAVRECVVVPMAVTETLNRLKSVITLRPGHANVSTDELREYVRARLAPYKVPRVFEVRDSLPKSPTGKVLREALQCE